ncbi:MAG: hypothetical protein HY352_06555 [Candidatus Omnitrophica bacterium]|nr:hypothetical protein [Candidatus Omnitrophota bacterium]
MMRTVIRGFAGLVVIGLAVPLRVAAAASTEQHTIVGEVVDPGLYLKEGRHGPETTDQTYQAVDGGQTLALLDSANGTLYLLLPEEPGEDPNELVYDHVNKQVKVTGAVYERDGVHGIVPAAVEPLESNDATASSSSNAQPSNTSGSTPPPASAP